MKNGHFTSLFLLLFGSAICILFKEFIGKVPMLAIAISSGCIICGALMGFVMLYDMPKNATIVDKII
jgi:hypothetical protein